MKIQRLIINHFSSHAVSDLEFQAPIALIVGGLNVGKSSILQAVEYALTGECAYHRKRTDDRSALIHDHGDKISMSINLETDKGRIKRLRTSENVETGEWNSQAKSTAQALNTAVTDSLGISQPILSALLNTSGFFDYESARQKEIIIGLIGAEITDQKVRALFTGDKEALKLVGGKLNSILDLQASYDYLFGRRTVAKRELNDLKPPDPPTGQAPPIEKLRATLSQCETELQQAVGERGKLEGQASVGTVRQQLEEKLKSLKASQPKGDMDVLKKNLEAVLTENAKWHEEFKTVEAKMIQLRSDVAVKLSNVRLLKSFKGVCVAGDHPCPAALPDMREALAEQEKGLKAAQSQYDEAEKQYTIIQRKRDDKSVILQAEAKIRDLDYAIKGWKRDVDSTANQLATLPAAADNTEAIARLDETIEKLRTRIDMGKKKIEEAAAWIERDRAVKAVALRRRDLETEVRHLEELVDFFGPKGVKLQLIDERIQKFVGEVNQHLNAFGYSMDLQVEPWTILAKGRPLNRLSRSERFRLGVAFQVAVARLTGFNTVFVDDAELLTAEARGQLIQMLRAANLDQAFVVMTVNDTPMFIQTRKRLGDSVDAFLVSNDGGVSRVEKV